MTTHNKLTTSLLILLLVVIFIWLIVPFVLAVLWSLVDPSYSWSYPDIFPKVLSFRRWVQIWQTTTLKQSLLNSYKLALSVTIFSLILASPTAYALGRIEFKGKNIAGMLILLPMVMPGFVIAIFFSSLLFSIGIYSKFLGILIGHSIIFMPYAIRILTVSFSQVRQDLIDAARNLGSSKITILRHVYLPTLKPGILAALVICFIKSIEEFAIAFIIGSPDFTTVPTILFSYLGYQFIRTDAAVVSLILAVPNILLMLIVEKWLRVANPATIMGKG